MLLIHSLSTTTPPSSLLKHSSNNTTKLKVGPTNFPVNPTSYVSRFTCSNLTVTFDDVASVFQNKVIIAAGVSGAIGQLSKPFTGVVLYGRPFDLKAFFQAGGFPSTHSSAVVATATCLALERGFSDSIFGMAAVYAALFMYDAQGVRREVGIHAKTLNKLLEYEAAKAITDGNKDRVNFVPGKPALTNLQSSTSLEESSVSRRQMVSTQSQETKSRNSMNEDNSTNVRTTDEESKKPPRFPRLKESIGHTEVEVVAGALLGLLVGLTVNLIM